MRDHAAAVDLAQNDGLAGRDVTQARGAFASDTEIACGFSAGAFCTGGILRVDGAGGRVLKNRQKTIERIHGNLLNSWIMYR